jgi:hypothetical protein
MCDNTKAWRPITAAKLESLLVQELQSCSPEDVALFAKIRIEPRKIGFERGGRIESVFVVAEIGERVLFYDDVEEEFEVATPDQVGVIRNIVGQFELCHALAQIRIGSR